MDLRAHVRRRFGGLENASDFARIKEPTRLGISLRAYEPGDTLCALSRSHLLRNNELVTRTDHASGRRKVLVVFHGYHNMTFSAPGATANKGQVGLALSALVELFHEGLSQLCRFVVVTDSDLGAAVAALGAKGNRPDEIYVVTDLLFSSASRESATRELVEALVAGGHARAKLMVVRDPHEHPDDNQLTHRSATLIPFLGEDLTLDLRYSGDEYRRNLRRQLDDLHLQARKFGFSAHVFTGLSSPGSVFEFLTEQGGRRP
jgi:hypothetical protein